MSITLPPQNDTKGFWGELAAGWATTRMLVALRWHMVRSPSTRYALIGGSLFFMFGWMVAMNLGYVVRLAALTGQTASGIYAQTWAQMVQYNQTVTVSSYVLGGAVLVAFLAPLTGTSTLSLVPTEDLHGLRPPILHRYFDSLIINFVSGIGLLQLLALTGIASLLTLDGERFPALLLAWTVWAFAVTLTTTMGWVLEWVTRRWQKTSRRVAGVAMFLGIGAILAVDPSHGKTLFGLGTKYTEAMRFGASHGVTWELLAGLVVIFSCAVGVALTGVVATRSALALPVPPQAAARTRKASPLGTRPELIAARMLLRILWRTPECRRPLLTVLVFGIPAAIFTRLEGSAQTTVILAVPLAVALAWGVNFFGVMGTGMTWMASQPKLLAVFPRVAMLLQLSITLGLLFVLGIISITFGKTEFNNASKVVVEAGLATLLVASFSIRLSVEHPLRARLSGRGDSLLPPLTALSYMFRLVFLSLLPGFALELPVPTLMLFGLGLLIFLLGISIYLLEATRWQDPAVRARVVTAVSAE